MEGGWPGRGGQGTGEEQADVVHGRIVQAKGYTVTRIAWLLENAYYLEEGALVRWLLSGWVEDMVPTESPGCLPRIMPSRIMVTPSLPNKP